MGLKISLNSTNFSDKLSHAEIDLCIESVIFIKSLRFHPNLTVRQW